MMDLTVAEAARLAVSIQMRRRCEWREAFGEVTPPIETFSSWRAYDEWSKALICEVPKQLEVYLVEQEEEIAREEQERIPVEIEEPSRFPQPGGWLDWKQALPSSVFPKTQQSNGTRPTSQKQTMQRR